MKYHKFTGVIINRHLVRDADRFFTIYTKELGKISVYAKGVRSVKSKRSGQLDLFSHIRFEVYENHDHLTLTSVELLDAHASGKTTLGNISRLFQIGELVGALTPEHDPHIEVYDLLTTAMANLARFETPEYLFRFKKKLLQLLGYWNTKLTVVDIDDYIESLLTRPLRANISI